LTSNEEQQLNEGANFWHYDIGVPTIPGEFKKKKPAEGLLWENYQSEPPSDEQHKAWLAQGKYTGGIMILCGRALHSKDKQNLYLVGIDIDNEKGLNAFLTRDGKSSSLHTEFAKTTLIEQHEDRPDRAHIFVYSPFKFPRKSPDNVIGLEIKSAWDHGLMRVTPSITESGYPQKILGITEPKILNEAGATELLQHLDRICVENGVKYLDADEGSRGYLTPELKQIIRSRNVSFDKNRVKIQSGYRNVTLISVANSILFTHLHRDKSNEEELKEFFYAINHFLCDGPLPRSEVAAIWASAIK
jgi:hypothetical protein